MITGKNKIKGRGTGYNTDNRFEKLSVDENFFDDLFYEGDDQKRNVNTILYRDFSRTAIAKNDSYDVSFDYSVNPYRGCEHGCVYCYARPTHEYLGFNPALDFETKIMVKEDIAVLLEETFNKKTYKPDVIMFSGNTDCYQPIEKKLELTRKCLEVCLKYKNPVCIITKSSMIKRDTDLLSELAKDNLVSVTFSVTSLDKDLQRSMEPRASSPDKRIEALRHLSENKIPVGINIAPVIPGLNDEEIPALLKIASASGAMFANYLMLRLPFSVKDLFIKWLDDNFANRKEKIISKIKEMRNGQLYDPEFFVRHTGEGKLADLVKALFDINCRRFGLNKEKVTLRRDLFIKNGQIDLFH